VQRPIRSLQLGVVLYKNTRRQLERLMRSVELNTATAGCPGVEIAFVDNSPTRELEAVVAEVAPRASYQQAPGNLGFGAGHNLLMAEAFSKAGAQAYVCLNPDGVLHPDCLRELAEEASRQQRAGLVEALQFPDEHPKRYDPKTHLTPWCSGCVLLITRELYEAVGGYDENFFMYCEDVDLSWRARAAGFSTSVAPRALVHHYVGARGPNNQVKLMMLRSGVYLAGKYGDTRLQQLWLGEYLKNGGEPFVVPPAPEPTPELLRVADLKHGFHMAEVRW
jgi:N-acetylglucosaminyl-diphospho-decaprenol L-rhamnosyltransferase